MRPWASFVGAWLPIAIAALLPFAACTVKEPQASTYFDRTIAPILTTSCARSPTGAGCHVASPKGNAFGNLDVSTFEGVDRRRDLLASYGPYGQATLLLKNVSPLSLTVRAFDGQSVTVTTDIKHAGGPILDPAAGAYATLRRWIESGGATANNTGAPPLQTASLPCDSATPSAPGFDPVTDPSTPDYAQFRDRASPLLALRCGAGNCHGSAMNALHLTCGDSPEQVRWNYFAATDYLGRTPEESEIVRRPLAPGAGGSFHEGGAIFQTAGDEGYATLLAWAQAHGPLELGSATAEFDFFAHRVQPLLVKKGCMLLHCHSTSIFHDYRLSGGAGGAFSLAATRRNYALSLAQLSLESPGVDASRLVRKNLYRPEVAAGGAGIVHRGGPLLEDFQDSLASAAACDARTYDYEKGSLDAIPAYCVIREWFGRERRARALAPLSAVVYVSRRIPAGADRLQDFDLYAPGAELMIAPASLTADGNVTLTGTPLSANAGCGLTPSSADIRRPSVSWDGSRIAFAARASATEPLAIYEMSAGGAGCRKHAAIDAGPSSANGLLVHDFDPAYSPPDAGGEERLVFASTRGNLASDAYDYQGPQRTPADPTKPNANLYVYEPAPKTPGASRIRQLTYLLDLERAPSFMSDGRLIFTTEKRAPGFYQLALRRMNLDGGDYHPLYGQRGSIGYREVTQGVQLADKNFAAIFSNPGARHRGGALGIINRSIGVDLGSAAPNDYPIDATVLDPAAPSSPEPAFFVHSLRFPDEGAHGVYASPAALPGGKVLVSFGEAGDPASFDGDYDLYVVDPASGAKSKLLGADGQAEIDAVPVYARAVRDIYASGPGQPNTYAMVEGETTADVTVHDMRMLASLLFQNTPTGRVVEEGLDHFDLYEDLPPTPEVTTFEASDPTFVTRDAFGPVYVRRRLLGTVPVASDGSARYRVPGGVPFVIRLGDTEVSTRLGLPRFQREEMMLTPGEHEHELMARPFFDGFCGQCHGSTSGRPVDVAMRPDVLAGASATIARSAPATDLSLAPSQRGPITGPPSVP
jgi:hypothetical protein